MATIDISLNIENINDIEIDKDFLEITYLDVKKIVKEKYGNVEGIRIRGWRNARPEIDEQEEAV